MSKAIKKSRDQLKSQGIKDLLSNAHDSVKGVSGVSKKSVTFHKATKDGASDVTDTTGLNLGVMRPTDEQLAQVNAFTRSPKTADEVAVFNTLSANTLPDRDDDYFDDETIDGFNALEGALSPVGKSYMVGHDYTKLPVGRIFSSDTTDAAGTHFLTNGVYIPNTEKNAGFLEDIDFGVNWAVSVGVMLDAQLCSICKEPQYSSFFFGGICDTGHFKGAMYDPDEDRTDDWGFILEARDGDPKAVKALGNMHGARDFYELSQVFLGAQFNAQLDDPASKSAGFSKMLKSAKLLSPGIPLLNLSAEDAESLPLPGSDSKVYEAMQKFTVERLEGGAVKWVDDNGLSWFAEPGDQVKCLGKSAPADDTTEGVEDGTASTPDGEVSDQLPEAGSPGEGSVDPGLEGAEHRGAGDDEVVDDADPGDDHVDEDEVGSDGDLTEDEDGEPDSDDDGSSSDSTHDDTEDEVDKAAVLAMIKRAKMPATVVAACEQGSGNGLDAALLAAHKHIKGLDSQVRGLTPKAAMGDKFIASKRAECIGAYVKATGLGTQDGVDVSRVERMLDSFGDDVDLIDDLTKQYEGTASSKLPGVRRSSAPVDPNERQTPAGNVIPMDDGVRAVRTARTATRIHG
jgi:hypothetical protein